MKSIFQVIFVLIYTFLYCFLMFFLYLFFRLSLYRSLARKDIRTRNSISAYPQIKKMAHKRALNVWNHENQRKFFFKDFFIFLVKRLCVKPTKTDKKERLKKDAHEPKKWTWKQMPNCLTKKREKNPSYTGNEWKKKWKIHVKWWWVKKMCQKSVSWSDLKVLKWIVWTSIWLLMWTWSGLFLDFLDLN